VHILSVATAALQKLFGPFVPQAAAASGVIQRQRVLTADSLARTFILGHLQHPRASDEELAQVAALCGTPVTPQAIEQRYTTRLVTFLESLFRDAVRIVVGADRALAPILERFPAVVVLDSTAVTLPDGQADSYPGCGGGKGGGAAALKLQTELDLRTGALTAVTIEAGTSTDSASDRQHIRRGAGALRLTDLGYFCLGVFAALVRASEHFLSRLQFGVRVFARDGTPRDLLPWLAQQGRGFIDADVLLGVKEQLAARLIAWRVPEEQANRRRQRLRTRHRTKYGTAPTADRLAWCDWSLLVTSVPADRLTPAEAVVLYRARWQVERLYRRWKSQGHIADLTGSTEARQMGRLWARLLAVLVQHWLVTAAANGDPKTSWDKAYEAVRPFAVLVVLALDHPEDLRLNLSRLANVLTKTCRMNPRPRPSTASLLTDPSRLAYDLDDPSGATKTARNQHTQAGQRATLT
jgi:hypothetical protein